MQMSKVKTNKTEVTQELEYRVYNYFYLNKGLLCGMEVMVPFNKRADFVGIDKNNVITVVEIKATQQDFKALTGHNYVGDKNYVCVPHELVDKVIDLVPKHVGIMVPKGKDSLQVIKNVKTLKHEYPKTFVDTMRYNIETAKQSNVRRLLYQRNQMMKSRNKCETQTKAR